MRKRHLALASRRGLALIAVLWMVAALSLIATSMAHAVRQEVRAVSGSRQAIAGQAVGQASIQMVLQEMAANTGDAASISRLKYVNTIFRQQEVQVRVVPLTGFIDINNAPRELLQALFIGAGQLAVTQATRLAAQAVEARSARDGLGRPIAFEAAEDLLRLPGFDYTLYAKVVSLVTADATGGGKVNPLAAPVEVLAALAGGDARRAAAIAAGRDAGVVGLDTTALNGEFTDSNATSPRFHLQARVPLDGGAWLLVWRIVDVSAARAGVPWRILRSGYRVEPAPERNS